MAITIDGTNGITTETGTGDVSVGDDLIFTGTGNRITGDFSNATVANRVMFQSSTTNGSTVVGLAPNGSSTASGFSAFNNSDPNNSSFSSFNSLSTETRILATYAGTGTYLPMTFYAGGSEKLRILTTGGITFNGDTAAANALDDYEEGTFTVTNNGDSTGTFSAQAGEYTKIGNICIVRVIFTVSNNFNQNAIGGLPFTAAGTSSPSGIGFTGSVLTNSSNQSPIVAEIDISSTSIYFFVGSNVTSSHTPNTTNSIYRLTIVYRTT